MHPIPCNESFNLAETVKLSSQREDFEDGIFLTSVPPATPLGSATASPSSKPSSETSPAAASTLKRQRSETPPAALKRPRAETSPAAASPLPRPHADGDLGKRHNGRNARAHRKRQRKREAKVKEHGHAPRPEVIAAHVAGATTVDTSLRTEELPKTSCGYAARSTLPGEGALFLSLQEALDAGYGLVKYDGACCMPLVCSEGRIFGCVVGQPDDPTYSESCRLAYEAIMAEGSNATFSEAEQKHRRGNFPAVNIGVTMGFGATHPTNLNGGHHADMMTRLLQNPHIMRLAHFADAAFAIWAPKLYMCYRTYMNSLFQHMPSLQHIFPKSVFPAAAFNFGPNVWTKTHRDLMNRAIGWCAIQALGPFDPKKGGHLVLPDLMLVIEFPPGALIFIPSATLTHGNIPVQAGDSRVSFTQYCGGGLFRYVDNGFRTEKQLRKEDPQEYQRMCALKATRWESDLEMYSKLGDLVSTA